MVVEDLIDESSHGVEKTMENVMSCLMCLVLPSTSILFRHTLKQDGHFTAWSKLPGADVQAVRVSAAKNWRNVAS